jgi:hypothetical protein
MQSQRSLMLNGHLTEAHLFYGQDSKNLLLFRLPELTRPRRGKLCSTSRSHCLCNSSMRTCNGCRCQSRRRRGVRHSHTPPSTCTHPRWCMGVVASFNSILGCSAHGWGLMAESDEWRKVMSKERSGLDLKGEERWWCWFFERCCGHWQVPWLELDAAWLVGVLEGNDRLLSCAMINHVIQW